MTVVPQFSERILAYALAVIRHLETETEARRAAGDGERQAQKIVLEEMKGACDEAGEEPIRAYPGAGTRLQKLVCLLMVGAVLLFGASSLTGTALPASCAILLSLACAALFVYRFFFDGSRLSLFAGRKASANLFGKRYARFEPTRRVVLVTRCDAPQRLRRPLFGRATPHVLTLGGLAGTALLFVSTALFLFTGAPQNSGFFTVLAALCLLFVPLYLYAALLADPNKVTPGVSEALVPTAIALALFRSLEERSERYERTELCLLVSGAEFSGRAGSYAFAKKHRRLFSDVPTVFLPIESVTSSKQLCVSFRGGSGSAEAASVVAEAADNLKLRLDREPSPLGSACFTPFAANGYDSCSLGTARRLLQKQGETLTADGVDKKAVADVGALLIESLNYFDSYGG